MALARGIHAGAGVEIPRFRPNDTEAQRTEKLNAARERLLEFTRKHEMPWPQLRDMCSPGVPAPKGLLQQFGVRVLPTYLLFDQNGMFVTDDLRGEKLRRRFAASLEL